MPPHRHRRPADQVQSGWRLPRHDQGHRHRDPERAGRNPVARGDEARQQELRGHITHVGEAGQESQHVDTVSDPGMKLHDLGRRQAGAGSDIIEIRCHLGVIANRQTPLSAAARGDREIVHDSGDVALEHRARQHQGFVEYREGAEGRNRLVQARDAACTEPPGQGQHDRIEPAVDIVAEFDHDRGVAGRQYAVIGHDGFGLTRATRALGGRRRRKPNGREIGGAPGPKRLLRAAS